MPNMYINVFNGTLMHAKFSCSVFLTVASQQDKENSDKRKKRPKSTMSLNQLKY